MKKLKLLVPTDFSETADDALDVAIMLALRISADIHLLHLEDIPSDWHHMLESGAAPFEQLSNQMTKVHEANDERLRRLRDAGVHATSSIIYREGYREILMAAKDERCDFIIMGAHGLTGLRGMLIGSYTQKLIRMADIPVLVVKDAAMPTSLQRVAFVSDFDGSRKEEFMRLLELIRAFKSKVDLVHINTPSTFKSTETIESRMKEYQELAPDLIDGMHNYNDFRFDEGLRHFCEKHKVDLVAIVAYDKRHSWKTLGAVAEDLVTEVNTPLLTVRAE